MIWGVSDGGLFSYNNESFDSQYTPIDGMYRLDGSVIYYIDNLDKIVIGYIDGMIDLFDPASESFETIEDIFRVSAFTSKAINDFQVHNGKLFVSSEFGIVVYDLNNFLVTDSYTKLGSFDRGTPVKDLFIENNIIYAATQQGVASGNLNNNLNIESSWTTYTQNDGLPGITIQSVIRFDGKLIVSTAERTYSLEGTSWQEYEPLINVNGVLLKSIFNNAVLVAHNSNRIYEIQQSGNIRLTDPGISGISDVIYDGEISFNIIVSSLTEGIGASDIDNNQFIFTAPGGPNLNFFEGIIFGGNSFLSGTTRLSQRNGLLDATKGYYIRQEGEWKNFNRNNTQVLRDNNFQQAFTTTINDEYFFIGSWGRGIARQNRETDEIEIFNANNSTLRGWAADDPNFPVISGLDTDQEGAVWATSRFATNPLYVQIPGNDEWINYGKSSSVSSSDEYVKLFLDSYNQKWITLESTGGAGRGLLVLDTGSNEDVNESFGVKLTDEPNNGNLPNMLVTDIIEDREGEVWVGTERGIARFILPQFIITGTQNERRGQWLLNEDPDADSPFLLRDISVTTMAVNSANQKWIGTTGEGVFLLNESGSAILKRFNTDNSPLFSNTIRDIEVYDETGEVYISTELGLSLYNDVPVAPVRSMENLKVYPNPFLYDSHERILIENLSDVTTLRILGVDGTLIRTLENRGGRAEWNGLDGQGMRVGSGVYVVVALGEDGNERGIGKVAIIR